MVGTTLADTRGHVESPVSHDGRDTVRCGRTGDRPTQVAGTRFDSRAFAERAAFAATQY